MTMQSSNDESQRLWPIAAGLVLMASVGLAAVTLLQGLRLKAEVEDALAQVRSPREAPVALSTEVFDRKGVKIGEFANEQRYDIRLEDLPPHVAHAFLASEDRDFYQHSGISIRAIFRSLAVDIKGGAMRQGASTITQQLARLTWLNRQKTWERKVKEALLALAIERDLSKDEILELYLNRIYFGNGSYGIEAAARNYLRKNAAALNVAEAALLAGLPQSPSRLAPQRHLAAARRRQRLVLRRMEAAGWLRAGEARVWAVKPLKVAPGREQFNSQAPYFLDAVRRDLSRKLESPGLPGDGLRIRTTLDSVRQRAAAASLARVLTASGHKDENGSEIEGALISIEPRSGRILAMQGGKDFAQSQFNRVEGTARPLGGAFVPIYVALALENGEALTSPVGDGTLHDGRPPALTGLQLADLLRGPIATAESGMPVFERLGRGTVQAFAAKIGLRFSKSDMSLALGAAPATPMALALAYSALVNGGHPVSAALIEQVETAKGELRFRLGDEAVPPLLGTAAAAALAGALAKGAGGVSVGLKDAWYISALPEEVTVIWLGAEHGDVAVAADTEAALGMGRQVWQQYKAMLLQNNALQSRSSPRVRPAKARAN